MAKLNKCVCNPSWKWVEIWCMVQRCGTMLPQLQHYHMHKPVFRKKNSRRGGELKKWMWVWLILSVGGSSSPVSLPQKTGDKAILSVERFHVKLYGQEQLKWDGRHRVDYNSRPSDICRAKPTNDRTKAQMLRHRGRSINRCSARRCVS